VGRKGAQRISGRFRKHPKYRCRQLKVRPSRGDAHQTPSFIWRYIAVATITQMLTPRQASSELFFKKEMTPD
jgi:hypothetical protein